MNCWERPGGWLSDGDAKEAASDRIRALAEESDSLSGFQCFAEDLSAWGGLATEVLQEIRDDYGSGRTVMLWALRSSSHTSLTPVEARRQRLREGLSTALLSQQCDVYVPMAPPASHAALPMLKWRHGDIFHESALLASALDSATLPYRITDDSQKRSNDAEDAIGALDFWSVGNLLTGQHNTPLCALSMAFPCPSLPINTQEPAEGIDRRIRSNTFNNNTSSSTHGFTSAAINLSGSTLGGSSDPNRFAECIILRGARANNSQLSISQASQALDTSLVRENIRCVQSRTIIAQPQPVPLPYPSIFSTSLSCFGERSGPQMAISSTGGSVVSCPVLVRMAGTSSFGPIVKGLSKEWGGCVTAAQGRATLDSWGIDRDQSDEVSERLMALSAAYDEEF